jgi:hypothetical protein
MAIQVCDTLQLSNSSDIIGSDGCSFLYKNLTDLRDVNTTGIADGNILVWDIATSTWVPGTNSGGVGSSVNHKFEIQRGVI